MVEEDAPLSQFDAASRPPAAAAAEDNSSSEEDIPLGQLCRREPSTSGGSGGGSNGAAASKKRAVPSKSEKSAAKKAKQAPKPAAKARTSSSTSRAAAAPATGGRKASASKNASDDYYFTLKGELVQKLLCRWWYAIDWPTQESIDTPVPNTYMPLDGYPGVHICVKGDDMGKIIDNRNPETCPSFQNLKAKTTEELKELLIEALDNQRRELIEHEGETAPTLRDLNKEIAWARKFNVGKADKEIRKLRL